MGSQSGPRGAAERPWGQHEQRAKSIGGRVRWEHRSQPILEVGAQDVEHRRPRSQCRKVGIVLPARTYHERERARGLKRSSALPSKHSLVESPRVTPNRGHLELTGNAYECSDDREVLGKRANLVLHVAERGAWMKAGDERLHHVPLLGAKVAGELRLEPSLELGRVFRHRVIQLANGPLDSERRRAAEPRRRRQDPHGVGKRPAGQGNGAVFLRGIVETGC